jgi:FMN-dependent NADH-azoreductase
MARKKVMVDGEAATERVNFAITPTMDRFLDAIALIHNTERTEIVRSLISEFIERYRETHGTHQIIQQIESEVSASQIDKLRK